MSDQIDSSREVLPQSCRLPGELMEMILVNLPVKSLLKFKIACKQWYSFISSPKFIKMHLHRQSIIADNLVVSVNENADKVFDEDCKIGLVSLANDESFLICMFPETPPSLKLEQKHFVILDSCNGVVCLHVIQSDCGLIVFWNPATRDYWYTDPPDGIDILQINTIGLCYVEDTNDYKLVGWIDVEIATLEDMTVTPCLFYYSLNSDDWGELVYIVDKFPEVDEHPTFLNGCMNWVGMTCKCVSESVCTCKFENMIMAFNVTTNVMSSFGAPNDFGRGFETSRKVLVIRGCLSIMVFFKTGVMEMELWRMVDYGVEGSWIKQFTIQRPTLVVEPLMSWQEEELVFIFKKKNENILTLFNPFIDKMSGYIQFKPFNVNEVFKYVESLVSVNPMKKKPKRDLMN